MMGGMEFADVVRRRKMVRNYTDEPVDPAVVDRALANAVRAPSAGFSQGWGFLVLDTPDDVRRFWAATVGDEIDDPDEWLRRHDARAGRDRALLEQGGLPGSLRRARQGLDRPRRGPLAGAVLAHGRRDGLAADPADGGRRRPRLLLLRHPARVRRAVRAEFAIPTAFDPVGAITLGHPAATAGAQGSPSRRRRKDLDEVVHRGNWSDARLTWDQSIQSARATPPDLRRGCLRSEICGPAQSPSGVIVLASPQRSRGPRPTRFGVLSHVRTD